MEDRIRSVVIAGAGAMGTLFGVRLARCGLDVHLLEKRTAFVDAIREKGLTLESADGPLNVRVPVTTEPSELPSVELVMICVKAYDTLEAAESLKPFVREGAYVLTLQNGLGNVETLSSVFGAGRILGGTTCEGANVLSPGVVRHAGEGQTCVAPLTPAGREAAEKAAEMFREAGFEAGTVEALDRQLWSKLVVNAGINAPASVLDIPNGELPEHEEGARLMKGAVREAVEVAEAAGVKLDYDRTLARVVEVARDTAENVNSMLADVRAGRRTEIDAISGGIVELGRRLGVPTPVNDELVERIRKFEARRAGA